MARNRMLKMPGTVSEYTPELINELIKCSQDPIYFIETYCKIIHPVRGLVPFALYDFQKDMITAYKEHRYNIVCTSRQVGKTQSTCSFILWKAMFNPNTTTLIASNKASGAKEIIERVKTTYENLPDWLRPAIDPNDWNKQSISFDNGSKLIAEATTPNTGRGLSISLLVLDEAAFLGMKSSGSKNGEPLDRLLWASISPTLAQGGSALILSTPNGDDNLFAELWHNAYLHKNNGFHATFVPWDVVPGRDEKFKQEEIAKIGLSKWLQEYECHFLSSDPILIDSKMLVEYTISDQPAPDAYGIVWFDKIVPGKTYLLGIDPSTGSGSDYHVIEVYSFPELNQIAEFRCNVTSTPNLYMTFKHILTKLQKSGAELCYWSFENNAVGEGFIAMYQSDENPVEFGDLISDSGKTRIGFNTNKNKMRLCVDFKEMFESGKIKIRSEIMISELKNFVRKGGSYAARNGSTDDVVMAHMIILRILQEIITYEDLAYKTLYEQTDTLSLTTEYDEYSEPMPIIGPSSNDYLLDYAFNMLLQ